MERGRWLIYSFLYVIVLELFLHLVMVPLFYKQALIIEYIFIGHLNVWMQVYRWRYKCIYTRKKTKKKKKY